MVSFYRYFFNWQKVHMFIDQFRWPDLEREGEVEGGREGERERERILKHPSRVPFPLVGDAADLLFLWWHWGLCGTMTLCWREGLGKFLDCFSVSFWRWWGGGAPWSQNKLLPLYPCSCGAFSTGARHVGLRVSRIFEVPDAFRVC
jgi:hypothetical protein